jgi:tRNA threonylcarbamoyladenosine biosynthesis protein TsaB
MMNLGIETSSKNCSVVLWDNVGNVWSEEQDNDSFVHAERLHEMIEALLNNAGVEFRQLTRVVVGRGPGSYTGLRIGVSCAKGIAYSLGIPLYSISSLILMGVEMNVLNAKRDVLLVMDARRNEVFGGWLRSGILSEPSPIVFDDSTLMDENAAVLILGENASKLNSFLRHGDETCDVLPSAHAMANPKSEPWFKEEDLAYFEPQYVKAFVPTTSKKV